MILFFQGNFFYQREINSKIAKGKLEISGKKSNYFIFNFLLTGYLSKIFWKSRLKLTKFNPKIKIYKVKENHQVKIFKQVFINTANKKYTKNST